MHKSATKVKVRLDSIATTNAQRLHKLANLNGGISLMSINIVFIFGAGASNEVNLPTGDKLKSIIARMLDIQFDIDKWESGDRIIFNSLKKIVQDSGGAEREINSYLQEAGTISNALTLAISIDNFIDSHRDNNIIACLGKLAIVRAILEAEKNSLLYFNRLNKDTIDFSSVENTWYRPFFQLLTENCGKNDLKERLANITLIIFNYDRCIEHFIYHALQTYYKISESEAASLVKTINFYHPYGVVGSLPWMNQGSASMGFGADPNPQQLLELSKKIKTFTEGTDPQSSEITEIKRHMALANRLVFLGFAFHKLNMQLIVPEPFDNIKLRRFKCYATTYDRSDSDKKVIEAQIKSLYKDKIDVTMSNLLCSKFFKEFWLSLTF